MTFMYARMERVKADAAMVLDCISISNEIWVAGEKELLPGDWRSLLEVIDGRHDCGGGGR